ncbi:MAG: hydrogenase subunit MbhD domain-containing protein [Bacillota bacterium]
MITVLDFLLLLFLIVCAVAVARIRDLLSAVVIFAAYSLVMAIIWQMLGSPDVAITEAALGAGVTTFLFIAAISRTRRTE